MTECGILSPRLLRFHDFVTHSFVLVFLDIDECTETPGICTGSNERGSVISGCTNTPGSWECNCAKGYEHKTKLPGPEKDTTTCVGMLMEVENDV